MTEGGVAPPHGMVILVPLSFLVIGFAAGRAVAVAPATDNNGSRVIYPITLTSQNHTSNGRSRNYSSLTSLEAGFHFPAGFGRS